MSRGHGGRQGERRGPNRFQKPQHLGSTIRRLSRYLKGRLHLLFIGLVLMAASSVAGVAANAMLRPIINAFVYERSWQVALPLLLQLVAIYLGASLAQYLGSRLMVGISQRTTHALRRDLFDHLQQLPLSFYDAHSHGELMSSFTNDIDNINQALDQSLVQIIMGTITFVGTLVMMLLLSPLLTLFVVLMVILMFLIVGQIMKHSATNFRRQQASLASLNGYIEEMMEGQKVVKVFNREAETIEGFKGRNEELRQASTRAQVFAVVLFPIMGNLSYVQYAFTAMAGAVMTIRGIFDIGSVASFLQFTREFSRPINQVSNQFNVLISALAGAERVFRLMDVEPELDEGRVTLVDGHWLVPAGAPAPVAIPGLENETRQDGSRRVRAKGDIRFEHVNFSYIPGTEVLHDISLYAKPGQRIAFVGSTGAGKTTVTNLINRFYDIDSGRILIDGIDLRQIRKADLRGVLGMVLQDIHLFEGTIADNIRYGRLDASDEEVREAARLANADGFIQHLPEGYDTMLTRDGSNLSQGQRQLLSIARAALADPLILVLDEATSSVDTRTEAQIEQGMDQLMAGRTVFAIAHRLSTVRHSDAILVIEDGVIIERGDHDQLMELGGRYYDLNVGTVELD
ncbi:MAG: ABC transporter ATP-binding protein [Bacillota bacterium]|nr:ABC transporter ATP-binding protein [Bacillota bacterium]